MCLIAQTLYLSLLVNSAHVLSQFIGFKKYWTSEIGQGFDLLHRKQERKKSKKLITKQMKFFLFLITLLSVKSDYIRKDYFLIVEKGHSYSFQIHNNHLYTKLLSSKYF